MLSELLRPSVYTIVMSKKIFTIIVLAVILTVGFVLVVSGVIGPRNSTQKTKSATLPNFDSIPKTASLYFSPPVLNTPSNPVKVDIMVETGGQEISGTQLELQYNPKILQNVTISSPKDSFFGSPSDYKILYTKNDPANGTVSFTIAANNRSLAKKGNGKVASLSFTVAPQASVSSTTLSFAPTTLVTIFGANQTILKEAAGLTVVLEKPLSRAQ